MVVKLMSYDEWVNAGLCPLRDCPPPPPPLSPTTFLNYLSLSKASQAHQHVLVGQHIHLFYFLCACMYTCLSANTDSRHGGVFSSWCTHHSFNLSSLLMLLGWGQSNSVALEPTWIWNQTGGGITLDIIRNSLSKVLHLNPQPPKLSVNSKFLEN